jgi:hypothetical protein
MTGKWPKLEINFINRNTSDTRWANLREMTLSRLDAMYEFHTMHGIKPQRGKGRHDADGSVIRWCFADPAVAKSFAAVFGTSD